MVCSRTALTSGSTVISASAVVTVTPGSPLSAFSSVSMRVYCDSRLTVPCTKSGMSGASRRGRIFISWPLSSAIRIAEASLDAITSTGRCAVRQSQHARKTRAPSHRS